MLQSKFVLAAKGLSKKAEEAFKKSVFVSSYKTFEATFDKGLKKSNVQKIAKKAVSVAGASRISALLQSLLQLLSSKMNALYSSKAISVIEEAGEGIEESKNSFAIGLLWNLKKSLLDSPIRTASVFLLAALATNIAFLIFRKSFDPFAEDSAIKITLILACILGLTVNVDFSTLLESSALKKVIAWVMPQPKG
jgi:hypothetical protein